MATRPKNSAEAGKAAEWVADIERKAAEHALWKDPPPGGGAACRPPRSPRSLRHDQVVPASARVVNGVVYIEPGALDAWIEDTITPLVACPSPRRPNTPTSSSTL